MRPDTKLKVARRKHTVELLRWLYARRDAKVDGARLSLNHRERQEGGVSDSRSLTYGEVDVPDFLAILDIVKPREGELFVDLGSGTGRAVLASSCGFPEFSKCLGIELVQGLVEAAADHVRMAKTFLAEPRPNSYGTAYSAHGNTDNMLSTKCIATVTGVSPVSSLGPHRDERFLRGGGGSKGGGRGRGGGGRNGKATGSKAASRRGLSAVDLEGLIAELLSRQPRPLPPPRPPQALEVRGPGKSCDATARSEPEVTAEEVASWLVRELGHRRYKNSLRGYGGLQKFLVTRRKNVNGGAPSRFTIAEDGSKVAAAPVGVSPLPVAWESSRDGGMVVDGSDKTNGAGTASCGCTTGRDCAAPCRCTEENDAATSTYVSAVKNIEAAAPTAAAAAAAAAAADSVTFTVSSASDDKELSSDSGLTSSPPRTAALTATSTSTPTPPSSSLSFSRVSSPAPPDKPVGAVSATPEASARASDGSGCSGRDSHQGGTANGAERGRLPKEGPLMCESLSGVEMVCGDIFEEDWSDAGVVYVSSLLFEDGMMIRLSKAAERLRQGARVISLRKIPTLTEDGDMPSQSETGVLAPRTEGGEIHNQSEQGVPAPIEGGRPAPIGGRAIPSQSEPIVPAPIEGGEILSQSERVVPAPVEGGETPSQSKGGDSGGLQGNSGSGGAPVRQPALRLLHEGVFRMSWQMARVYIYVRT